MKIKSAVFETSAPTLASAPRLALPEFAFIGRSNVGKSSLVNLLSSQRDLARVSDLPGKTRLMNFYTINLNWRLVDLPGYGYAHVSKTQRADFNEAAADYIKGRKNLREVFVLIDSRLEPLPIDLAFIEWQIESGIPYSLVFTKADKQSVSQTQNRVERFCHEVLGNAEDTAKIFITSAKTKLGRIELLKHIADQL